MDTLDDLSFFSYMLLSCDLLYYYNWHASFKLFSNFVLFVQHFLGCI